MLTLFATCCVAQDQILPPGNYIGLDQPTILYKGYVISIVEQQFEVQDNGVSLLWLTRMQYYTESTGTVQALVTLSMTAARAPSGNLLLAIDQCVQNNLGSQFSASMCNLFFSEDGCIGNEFVYSQIDKRDDYVNETMIAIQTMCGVNGILALQCLAEGLCQGPLPGFGPTLPSGCYKLFGPASSFLNTSGLDNVNILPDTQFCIDDANVDAILDFSLVSTSPFESFANVTVFFSVLLGSDGKIMFYVEGCTMNQPSFPVQAVCSYFYIACEDTFTVAQILLNPGNDTHNDTLLILQQGFCGLDGVMQQRCLDDDDCEMPLVNSAAASLGFTLGPCLYFNGKIIEFDQSCVTQVVNQTVIEQFVDNSTVINQYVDNSTVVNQFVDNSTVLNQFVYNETAVNLVVQNSSSMNNLYVNFIQGRDGEAVTTATIDALTVNTIYGQILGYLDRVLYSGPATYTMVMGLQNGIGCTASGSLTFDVQVQRIGLFVSGILTLTAGTSVDGGGGNSCNYFGYVSGQKLGLDYRPATLSIGLETSSFLQNQDDICFCTMVPEVDNTGTLLFNSVNIGNTCCTGAISFGYQANKFYLAQIVINGGHYPFSYNLDSLQ